MQAALSFSVTCTIGQDGLLLSVDALHDLSVDALHFAKKVRSYFKP